MSIRTRSGESDLRPDAQAGFTLVEMMISIVLLTIIIGAISAAVVSSMNATSSTKQRVGVSNDAQLIAGFLTRDAQAAGGTDPATGKKNSALGVWSGSFASGCSTPPPGTPILGLKWIDLASGTTYSSNYSYVATATGTYQPQQLLRTMCTTTSAVPPATDAGTSVLANNVVTTATPTLATPTAWCDTDRPQATPCPTPLPAFPDTVSMGVSMNNATQTLTPPFSFILTASLRPQSDATPDGGSLATTASLLLLGGADCVNAQSASFNLTIYGSTELSACTTDVKKPIDPFGPVFVSAPGTCANFPATPPCTVVNSTIGDPYQAMIDRGDLTAPAVDCTPGPNPPTVGGHWQPGTYKTDPQASGPARPFDPGVYVFCNGLSGDVKANLPGGPIGGTFFYFHGGSYNVCLPFSNGCQSDVLINPPTTGQYAGLAVWQRKADTTPMVMSKGLVNITGTVYAPSATVTLKNGTININQLIAFRIDGNPGNPDVHVGPPLRVIMEDQLPPYTLPPYTYGQATYAGDQATAVDGTGVYNNWTISGVAGLTISSTGVIGGKPIVNPGNYTVTVGVRDNDGESASLTASITINPALTISGSLPDWTVNQPGYPANPLTASGGPSGTTYTWTASGLPTGLSMDATGTISGGPTTVGTYNPTITLTDSVGDVKTMTPNPTVNITPRPTILGITVTNGGTARQVDQDDTVSVRFSQQMDVSSFCSTWTGDGSNQTLRNNNDVTVTLHDGTGATHDSITVNSVICPSFNFGSIDLGTNAYVSGGDATFTGKNGSRSMIDWDASTHTLTLTLGATNGSGVLASVASSTPTYTASGSIADSQGATISNSPFVSPTPISF